MKITLPSVTSVKKFVAFYGALFVFIAGWLNTIPVTGQGAAWVRAAATLVSGSILAVEHAANKKTVDVKKTTTASSGAELATAPSSTPASPGAGGSALP